MDPLALRSGAWRVACRVHRLRWQRQEEPVERTPSIYRFPAKEASHPKFKALMNESFDTLCVDPAPTGDGPAAGDAAPAGEAPSSGTSDTPRLDALLGDQR